MEVMNLKQAWVGIDNSNYYILILILYSLRIETNIPPMEILDANEEILINNLILSASQDCSTFHGRVRTGKKGGTCVQLEQMH